MKILLTGATGFIGSSLSQALFRNGHDLVVLARSIQSALSRIPVPCQVIEWDPLQGKSQIQGLGSIDAVVHLAGESIAGGRWTSSRKKKLWDSRVIGTRELLRVLRETSLPSLRTVISASAVGIYGDRGDSVLTEDAVPGHGFLADLCKAWESELFNAALPGVRKAALRFGMVLGTQGGALPELLPIFKAGLGGPLGNGSQWMSWIHLEDLVRLIEFNLENTSISGPVNAVSPDPVTNAEFSKSLGKALHRPVFFTAPAPALKLALGEMSQVLLSSQRVLPKKATTAGFQFKFSTLAQALENLLLDSPDEVFETSQFIPKTPNEIFSFFSDSAHLEAITPPWLSFQTLKQSTPKIGQDTLIEYQLKLHGIPIRWKTQIENWNPNQSFSDVQLKGPYKKWHHDHQLEQLRGGTLMTDRIRYRVPGGALGQALAGSWIRRDIQRIFNYRKKKILELF